MMDSRDLKMTKNAYFSLLTHTKQLLLVTFCNITAGIGASFSDTQKVDEQTDVEVAIVI